MDVTGIVNFCRLFRHPRMAWWCFRSQPAGFLRGVLSGGLDVHFHD